VNVKTVLEFGLKLAIALGAGLAMFAGVNEAIKRNNTNEECRDNSINNDPGSRETVNNKNTGDSSNRSNTVVSGLRAASSTCGKLFTLAQGLVTVAESLSTLSSSSGRLDYGTGGYYQGGGGQRWRRVNPFILESVPPDAPINFGNQYPF
jgi:hypothetical protein